MTHITVEGRTLAAAMKEACAIVERRSTIPILGMVRITAGKNEVTIRATDLDMQLTRAVDVYSVEGVFDICLPAHLLFKIAKTAGVELVRIEPKTRQVASNGPKGEQKMVDEHYAVVCIGEDARFEIDTLPAYDWPEMGFQPTQLPLIIEKFTNGRLAEIMAACAYAISSEETRYYLNGLHWSKHEKNGSRMVATDGHRLVCYSYDDKPCEEAVKTHCIVPRRTVAHLIEHAKAKDVTAYATDVRMEFVYGQSRLHSKLIDGTFPDYTRVIPSRLDTDLALTFDAAVLRLAIERAVTMSSERGRAVKLYRDGDGKISVFVNNPDAGSGMAKTGAEWPEHATDHIGFNARYLQAALPKAGTVTLQTADSGTPAHLIGPNADITTIIMPMRA